MIIEQFLAEVRTSLDLADLFLIRATVNALISTFSMNIFHMTRNTTLIFKSFITNWALHRLFLKASLRGIREAFKNVLAEFVR